MTKLFTAILATSTLFLCGMVGSASAQIVEARISTHEAYVGMPVVLHLTIQNASDYNAPAAPEIDGCDVRSAGTPSQSSQITIINGRRSESRSVTMQYLITPRREGTFEVPSMTVNVDGRDQTTRPLRFVATKSETGDLLFVEIEGGKDKVFVGQPLDLTLKIWIKPFVDRQNNIKLSQANMWQMISEQTSWGSFSDRLQELAENNQRPSGREVVRDNGQRGDSAYYLYEIRATVYPKRPGKIDADDVQIVVNYPTGVGKSRDPFASMFADSPFGGMSGSGSRGISSQMSSRMQQLMDDEFFSSAFGGSPFGNRLSVTTARPIVGQVSVDSTEVVPVPVEGRPVDYRGAVGRYQIATQATPTAVSAGDPITLNIGIVGTGPMELVQAPPLSQLSSLTSDFKVADQSLAGFVQDETKVFSTTIRPRHEGITSIPPIPFSFFDPESEKFETVMSKPISISVEKAESLALDAIVGNARRNRDQNSSAMQTNQLLEPNFTNHDSERILVSQAPASSSNWWWVLVFVPPLVWLGVVLIRKGDSILAYASSCNWFFRSALAQCVSAIDRATTNDQIENAMVRYIDRRTQTGFANRSLNEGAAISEGSSISRNALPSGSLNERSVAAVGALRTSGMYHLAAQVESVLQRNQHSAIKDAEETSVAEYQKAARKVVDKMEAAFNSMNKSQVRLSSRLSHSLSSNGNRKAISTLLIAGLLTLATSGDLLAQGVASIDHQGFELTKAQSETIFAEANESYSKATEIAKTDSAEANDLFTVAASKYKLLVDSGIRNSQLYFNLGNAYLQSNRLGNAIVNYERAKTLDPNDDQLLANLEFANALVQGQDAGQPDSRNASIGALSVGAVVAQLRGANHSFTGLIGTSGMAWVLVLSSFAFWALLIARTVLANGNHFPIKRLATIALLCLVPSAISCGLIATTPSNNFDAVIVSETVTFRAGDGEQFDAVATVDSAQGHRVQVINQRGDWIQVKSSQGQLGWLKSSCVETTRIG